MRLCVIEGFSVNLYTSLPLAIKWAIDKSLKYRVDQQAELNQEDKVLYKQFKKTFKEIKDWEAGKVKLQPAKEALAEIEAGLRIAKNTGHP